MQIARLRHTVGYRNISNTCQLIVAVDDRLLSVSPLHVRDAPHLVDMMLNVLLWSLFLLNDLVCILCITVDRSWGLTMWLRVLHICLCRQRRVLITWLERWRELLILGRVWISGLELLSHGIRALLRSLTVLDSMKTGYKDILDSMRVVTSRMTSFLICGVPVGRDRVWVNLLLCIILQLRDVARTSTLKGLGVATLDVLRG